jgi:protein-disulfide isomerase
LERALERVGGEVQMVLYPFVLNPRSNVATQAALCAGEQGKFWEFHRMLYARQDQWSQLSDPLEFLLGHAEALGVEKTALQSCVKSGRMQQLIDADQTYGRSLGVRSTPTLFINNQRLVGTQTEGDLVRVIREELARARRASS